jgi:fructokinase
LPEKSPAEVGLSSDDNCQISNGKWKIRFSALFPGGRTGRMLPKNSPPSPEAAARLLSSIYGAGRVSSIQPFTDGLTNFNYKVSFSAGAEPVVLRIYGRDSTSLQKEVDLLQTLQGLVPVPGIMRACPEGGCEIGPFIITRYVEGITFRELKRTGDAAAIAQAAEAIGETLASVSRIKLARRGALGAGPVVVGEFFNGPTAIPKFIETCLASPTLIERLDRRVRDRVRATVQEREGKLAELHRETRLVHNDFGNRNVLVRPERGRWRVAAVIDWEFAASGSPLFDVASFLRYERDDPPTREPHFSRGYQQGGGRLPDDWRRLGRVMDLTKLCQTLTEDDLPAEIVTEVAELVRESIDAMD